jgi:hypothetical protein
MTAETDRALAEAFAKLSPEDQAQALSDLGCYGRYAIHVDERGKARLVRPNMLVEQPPSPHTILK